MGKGYYWIPQTDRTLNDFQFYRTFIYGKPEFDDRSGRMVMRTVHHFPVGSIFHVLGDCQRFVVDRKFKTWGNKYLVRPYEGEWTWEAANKLREGVIIFRDGYVHGDDY